MTLVSLPSPIGYPGIVYSFPASATLGTVATIDAAGEYVSYIFSAREDMVISHVGFRAGTSTGSPNVIVSIEGVDTSGLPDGAATYGGSASAATLVSSNTNPLIALGGAATVTKGQVFCVKIAYSSGTSQIIQDLGNAASMIGATGLPYRVLNTGTPTKSTNANNPLIALGSSATTFYNVPGTMPISNLAGAAFNNTNSAKRGLKFTPPMNCRAIGLRFWAVNSTGDYNAGIYDVTGAGVGGSVTAFDGDQNSNGTGGITYVYFDTPVTLTRATAYYAAIEPSSATNANMPVYTLPTSDYFTATPAGSTAVYSAFATSSWTDSTTQLPFLDVIIDQVDDGTGSGSGGGGQRVISG
jgi:hypothetical protein